uniref:VWFC domain-containing protein n=1 Tax=Acanthochromis polyacanthus TaxID=80966 RepID=A0A3Q1GG99_9TELE
VASSKVWLTLTDRCFPEEHARTAHNGGVQCSHMRCPNPACERPVTPPGECCPVCTGMCLYHGREYQSRSTFTSPTDPCSSCSCMFPDGQSLAMSPNPCPKLNCTHQVTDPGTCCPLVDVSFSGCIYGGEERAEGSSWFADSTPCMNCMCVDGVTTCSEVQCPPVVCLSGQKQVKPPGKCCPECQEASCLYQGTVYHSNEQWEVDECTSCTCVTGDVHCRSERCPPLTCATVSSTSTHTRFLCISSYSIPRFVLSSLPSSSSHLHCLWRPSLPNLRWPHAALPGDVHVRPG